MVNFDAYIPIDRRFALHNAITLPDRAEGAVLFADISDFSTIAADLEQSLGPRQGADALMTHVNLLYKSLINEVHRYGGSVISFSGDAITCWFDEKIPDHQGVPGSSAQRATACAIGMQTIINRDSRLVYRVFAKISLSIKISVVAGIVRRFLVGSPNIQSLEILAGKLLDRSAAAEKLLQPGQVIVGAEVLAHFGPHLQVSKWLEAANGEHYALVEGISKTIPPASWPDLPPVDPEIARDWLLPPIYRRLQRGEGEFLAELRPSIALFLNYSGIDYDADDQPGEKLDAFIRWVQIVLEKHGGYLLQVIVGDKGSYVFAAIGTTIPHKNNALVAAAAAHALQILPPELNFISDLSIGISSGTMLVGAYGSDQRRTFSEQGSETNLAARLMEIAKPGEILVTAQIAEAMKDAYVLRYLGATEIRGWADALHIFAIGQRKEDQEPAAARVSYQAPIVGRAKELNIFKSHLEALMIGHEGAIIVEGEEGMGRSRLVRAFLQDARGQGLPAYLGAGDAVEKTTPLHAWRPIFREILNLKPNDSQGDLLKKVSAVLPADKRNEETAAMIDNALALSQAPIAAKPVSTGMPADLLRELMLTILAAPFSGGRYILIFDDAQWIDSASWALLGDAQQSFAPHLTVIATRPIPAGELLSKEYNALFSAPKTKRLRLEPLAPDESSILVAQDLGVNSLPHPVAEFIGQRAAGQPFFSEEIGHALLDSGVVNIQGREMVYVAQNESLGDIDFPATMQGVIASRIDRLDAPTQLTLKVASVIGSTFPFDLLFAIHPVAVDKENLPLHLAELARLDLISPPKDQEAPYAFKHWLIQENAYDRLLNNQRSQLHQLVGEWLEKSYPQNALTVFPLLAHHWGQAAVAKTGTAPDSTLVEKALHYSEISGEQALINSAYREAIHFFNTTVDLAATQPATVETERQARWLRQLGEAYHQWGQWSEARDKLSQAAALFGWPIPSGRAAVIGGIFGQFLIQVRNRLWPSRFVGAAPESEREIVQQVAHIYQLLGELSYLTNDTAFSFYAILKGLNLGEYGGMSPELVKAYSDITVIAGLFGPRRMAEGYGQRAWQTAVVLDDVAAKVGAKLAIGLYALNAAQLNQARENIEAALNLSEELGDRRLWGDSIGLLARTIRFQGDLERASELYTELAGPRSGVMMHQVWAHNSAALIALRQDDLDKALACLEMARSLPGEKPEPQQALITWSYLGIAYLRRGEYGQAREAAGKALTIMEQIKASAYTHFEPMSAVVEIYLALWELPENISGITPEDCAAVVKDLCRSLQKGSIPLGQPAAALYQGWYDWLAGIQTNAVRRWAKGLAAAEKAGMPYELGLLHLESGRHLPVNDPRRRDHLDQALKIFAAMGANYQRDRTHALLDV